MKNYSFNLMMHVEVSDHSDRGTVAVRLEAEEPDSNLAYSFEAEATELPEAYKEAFDGLMNNRYWVALGNPQ